MSIQEMDADVCEICDCYSNSGFDLCEECARKFVVWFFLKHHKNSTKIIKEELLLDDENGLWGYSKVDDFVEKEYEKFKKESDIKFDWYEDKLNKKDKTPKLKGVRR